jgi:hypothetical protein
MDDLLLFFAAGCSRRVDEQEISLQRGKKLEEETGARVFRVGE